MKQFELIRMERGEEKERFPITGEQAVIGRSTDATICLDGKTVSRKHIRLWTDGNVVSLEDLGSRNGFKINGIRVRSGNLHMGDMLDVGQYIFILSDSENSHKSAKASSSKTAAPAAATGPPRYQAAEFRNDETRNKAALAVAGKLQPYLLDIDTLVAKMGMAVLQSVPAQRSFLLARRPGQTALTVLGMQSGKSGGKGPSLDRNTIDTVDSDGGGIIGGDMAESGDQFGRTGPTGVLCVPLVGRKERFGVIYADSGFSPSRFVKSNLEDLKALGRAFGATLETAFQLEAQAMGTRNKGQAEAAEALARLLEHRVSESEMETRNAAIENIIENARAYARAEALEITALNAAAVIEETIGGLQSLAQQAGVQIQYEPAPRLVARADADALRTITKNLLHNAVESGGGEVSVRAVNDAKNCVIEVIDNGPGIPTERCVRFHADLAQADPKRGAGLGLATVHRLTQALNGTIEFQKRLKGGTHVRLTIPGT